MRTKYKLYFQYRHEVQPKDDVFVCIVKSGGSMSLSERIAKIQKRYALVWREVIHENISLLMSEAITIEELTNDEILQGWESFEGVILENLYTGKRYYYYEDTPNEKGYELIEIPKA